MKANADIIHSAATDLENAATAIQAILSASLTRQHMPPAMDEASTAISGHLNHAPRSHDSVAQQAITELQHAAKTLRKHANEFAATDDNHSSAIDSVIQAAAGVLNV